MKKITSYISFLVVLLFINSCGQKYVDPPNIILIIGDDHGYPYFGFMGSEIVKTPNMDSLANSGVLFKNGYVPENHCRPALQSLITGMRPIDYNKKIKLIKESQKQKREYLSYSKEKQKSWERDFKYHAMKYVTTMPEKLQEIGYKSFQSGKWWEYHFEYGGFTDGMTKGWVRENKNGMNWFEQFMGGKGIEIGRLNNNAVFNFIEKNKSNPFFIWYAPSLPHYPFDAPQKYRNIYLNKGYSKSAVEYYANCTWFDDAVGDLIAYLKKNTLIDNTLFIYVNDNGWEQETEQEFINDPMRSHNGGDKGKLSLYDLSFRTPIIFSWKNRIKPNIRLEDLVHSADIPATILDIVNLEKEEDYFGISLKSQIMKGRQGIRKNIIGKSKKIRDDNDPMGKDVEAYWARENEWFYSLNKTDDIELLFDVEKDPLCNLNLSTKYPELVSSFRYKIELAYQKTD